MSQWRVAALRSPQPDHCRVDRESLSVDTPAFSPWTCINCVAGSHDSSLNLNGVTTLNMAGQRGPYDRHRHLLVVVDDRLGEVQLDGLFFQSWLVDRPEATNQIRVAHYSCPPCRFVPYWRHQVGTEPAGGNVVSTIDREITGSAFAAGDRHA
ncbi:hypothetical protein [Mycobacterium sp. OTB74]|uniref:hypothetical protein n=1 Tax=Mycobacterium sp. OTB74 TaxID=1853452 RepID=UPI0024763192|nr:hypothetical protein [Mycobacterium sp. OTB74]MDH6242548.1 hypothetical protein [Mycobacterium sp. OTB74]